MNHHLPTFLMPLLPLHGRKQRIGIFGGSFNPAHAAHRLVSLTALRRLKLDAIWWIVTPGNPLKDKTDLPSTEERIALAKTIAAHPKIHVIAIEERLGSTYTHELIAYLKRRSSTARFVWIMGADNLESFHRWARWRSIFASIPVAVIDRPGSTHRALHAPAALAYDRYRVSESKASAFPNRSAPALIVLHGPRSNLSSTALRKRQ
jgi:nicotinate-nucleotide adenylyltransferase